ncbi:ABC transporter ATP-binding protein [Sulfitobacter mediterraneus]|uniref:ABC transporter ATP-binding protein n=1 Tax=Sulfitobacter mediterraneus TaxID=83219 RepID=UPI0021A92E72|nr:ABC transporter ATP-binding protein [Sulfitobacter mediterraneus]
MNAIDIKNLSKTFVSTRTGERVIALENVNLSIPQGEFTAIVGPSGCGKSTLLSIMAGILAATEGQAVHFGETITGPAPDRGVLFQDYALFPWLTVRQNIAFGPKALGTPADSYEPEVDRLITVVGLEGFGDRLPHELSGGMRQRCALARMLANNPRTWLMDEPLAAVDLQTRTLLQEEILRVWGEDRPREDRPTIVFITHGIDEAVLLADRVVVLGRRPGRVKAEMIIDLPRPRFEHRDPAAEGRQVQQIWDEIREEARTAILED